VRETSSSERLLAPTGRRASESYRNSSVLESVLQRTWNRYRRGIGTDTKRLRAHSYRFCRRGRWTIHREASWRASERSPLRMPGPTRGAVVVQTGHFEIPMSTCRITDENSINDLFPDDKSIAPQLTASLPICRRQIVRLPVGGQCSRVLAEMLLTPSGSATDRRKAQMATLRNDSC